MEEQEIGYVAMCLLFILMMTLIAGLPNPPPERIFMFHTRNLMNANEFVLSTHKDQRKALDIVYDNIDAILTDCEKTNLVLMDKDLNRIQHHLESNFFLDRRTSPDRFTELQARLVQLNSKHTRQQLSEEEQEWS